MATITKVFNIDDTGVGEGDGHANTEVDNLLGVYDRGNWSGSIQILGESFKLPERFRPLDVFLLSGIAVGSTIRRVTVERELDTPTVTTLDSYRVGLHDPSPLHSRPVATEDGVHGGVANWVIKDATRNTPVVWSDFEAIGEVYDDVPAETNDGPDAGASGGNISFEGEFGFGTFGAAWTASSTYTLGQVRLRISRVVEPVGNSTDPNTSRPGVNLFIEVYDAISATDRRPTGSPIATSDALSWDSLDFGGTPSPDKSTWAIFSFTAGPTIASGSIHVYKLVVDGGAVLPTGTPYIRTAIASTTANNAAGVFWGAGGWTFTSYPHVKGIPNASENISGGPLVAGRLFQDDECIISPRTHLALLRVWGHDIDNPGLGIDFPLDGSGASTTNFVQLFQDWIDRVGYDPTGDRVSVLFDMTSGDDDTGFSFDPQEAAPNFIGMVLRITFDEPILAFRAVEKRVAIFPAEARLCAPDAESRDFMFPEAGKRTRTFDFEDRTARFPKDDRDKEFC